MSLLIPDANVVIKWLIAEQGTAEALALRGQGHRFAAPDLLIAESANIIWKKVHRGELTPAVASVVARAIEQADIDIHSSRPLLTAAVDLAIALDHPAYDCLYLTLAETLDGRLVTADERLLRKLALHAGNRFTNRVVPLMQAGPFTPPAG